MKMKTSESIIASLVLVMPPQAGLIKGFATGLISIANYIASRCPESNVEILDLSETPLNNVAAKIEPLLRRLSGRLFVGITSTTASYQSALHTAREFRTISRSAIIVFGGPHPSADPSTVLRSHPKEIDFVVVGEGEIPMLELIRHFPRVKDVPGLSYVEDKRIIHNPIPPLLDRRILDTLSMTFRGDGLQSAPGKFEHVTYVSARGCPLHCSFCSVANQSIRTKSTDQVREDIRQLVGMGFTKIAIEDNFFAHSFARTMELCKALKGLREEIGNVFSWDCQTRVESMARTGIVPLMESAGCEGVYVGAESLNKDTLRYLGKTLHPEHYLGQLIGVVIPRILDSKMQCYLNLQFGLPHETSTHHEKSLDMLKMIGKVALARDKTITIFPQLFVLYPGTTHFKEHVDQGTFGSDIFESFTKWEMEKEPIRRWLGEFFAHGIGGLPIGILDIDKLSKGEFCVIPENVAEISAAIRSIDGIDGINVFRYGSYLTAESEESPDGDSSKVKTKMSTEVK